MAACLQLLLLLLQLLPTLLVILKKRTIIDIFALALPLGARRDDLQSIAWHSVGPGWQAHCLERAAEGHPARDSQHLGQAKLGPKYASAAICEWYRYGGVVVGPQLPRA